MHENFKKPQKSEINFLNPLNIKFQKTKMLIKNKESGRGEMSMQFRMA